ncbi:hypothetical protein [Phenylobacterium aquaticum]|uniref:hypothetical protein n=1 Tax=Phenylobacterium aquaticum TaxID=1763816 RepID=UPI001F5D6955|nr:hypothetical protein [Phenylobacterium aquaticum]MCI3133003.1 hypothetical protein [Phenylobacterium aquaticum]
MTRIPLFAALAAALAAASTAGAQEAISTAPAPVTAAASAAPAQTSSTTTSADTAAQIDSWIKKAPPVDLDDGAPDGVTTSQAPRKVHGEVGVTVGSGGYRSAYAVSVMPIGETGTLTLAVSEAKGGRRGGFGYGYGGPGFGRFGGYGGDHSSFALGLALGESTRQESRCPEYPTGPLGFEDHAGPDLYRAECRARARVNNQPD